MVIPRLLITGDAGESAPWIGIAKKLARRDYEEGIFNKVYAISSDVTIRVENAPGRGICKVWVEALGGGMYMESGYVSAQRSTSPGGFFVKNPIYETDETDGAVSFKDSINPSKPREQKLYTDRSHAIPGGYFDKRIVFPIPLMATGLLRTTLQSKLGYAEPKYSVPAENEEHAGQQSAINKKTLIDIFKFMTGPYYEVESNQWEIYEKNRHLRHRTYGMLATEDRRYYLIEIRQLGTGLELQIVAYQCAATGTGKVLLSEIDSEQLAFTDEEKRRLEGYILATLSVDFEKRSRIGIVSVAGQPVHNGWHFNKRGDKADIVTIENITDDISGLIKHLTNRHYSITFSENTELDKAIAISNDNQPLFLTMEILEEVNCTPTLGVDNLWIPNYLAALQPQMEYYYWRFHSAQFLDYQITSDAPVYGFYNYEDKFVMLRVSFKPNATDFDNLLLTHAAQQAVNCGAYISVTLTSAQTSSTYGFYVTTDGEITGDYRLPNEVGQKARASAVMVPTGTTYTVSGGSGWSPHFADCTGIDYTPYLELFTQGWSVYAQDNEATGTEYASSSWNTWVDGLSLIPFFDAESIYVGNWKVDLDSGVEVTSIRYGIGEENITWQLGTTLHVHAYSAPTGNLTQVGGHLYPPNTSSSANVYNYVADGLLDLYTLNGRISNVATMSYVNYDPNKSIDSIIAETIGWSRLVDPILFGDEANPYFYYPFIVEQGNLDNVVYFTDPMIPQFTDGIEQTGIVIESDTIQSMNFAGMFSGWT